MIGMAMAATVGTGMARPIALLGGRVLDPSQDLDLLADVYVRDGVIAGLVPGGGEAVPGDALALDVRGLVVVPGLIDARVHLGEPGFEHKETLATGCAAAVCGGVTAVICMPDTDPVIDAVAGVEFIARRARETRLAKVYVAAALTRGRQGEQLSEMGLLREAGAVAFTDGPVGHANAALMRRALQYAARWRRRIAVHPEEPSLAAGGVMTSGEMSTRLGLRGIPREAEVIQVERDLRLAAMTGGPLHITNVSTGAALEAVRAARARGVDVTCDTAPPYFALNLLEIGDYRTFARMSPPLRLEEDREAVVAAIADGTIDLIASDHRPHDQDSKRVPFAQAEPGGIGLETLLPIVLEMVHKEQIDLRRAVELLSCAPARTFGLPGGTLRPGTAADITVLDPDRPWRVEPGALRSKSKNTPFDGRPVQGRAVATLVDGRIVHDANGLTGSSP